VFKNINYDYRKSTIHLWETINGEDFYDEIQWVPYVWLRSPDGITKNIDGDPVIKKTFKNYYEYKEFISNNEYICYENRIKPEIQFLVDRYYGINDDKIEVPVLKLLCLDIEVDSDSFPDPQKADDCVTAITTWNSTTGNYLTFGIKPANIDNFIYCESEETLLKNLIAHIAKYRPDVIMGWNVYYFDIPYIVNRAKKILDESYLMLSPIGHVRTWKAAPLLNDAGKPLKGTEHKIDIAGVAILDYLDLYKTYGKKQATYTLGWVAQQEIDETKTDFSENAASLRDLYENHWEKYIEYNIQDVNLVVKLHQKLNFIGLTQALSLLSKTPLTCYSTVSVQIEGILLSHLRRKNKCGPILEYGIRTDFQAAYVKEPKPGLYNWIVDIDVASQYPTSIIILNMSLETYFGKILNDESSIVDCTRKRHFDEISIVKKDGKRLKYNSHQLEIFNKALKQGYFSIAPNGAVFDNRTIGFIPEVEKRLFSDRKKLKADIKILKQQKKAVTMLDKRQLAYKTILNSMYGVLSLPYSRYSNINIAEAITSCGRHILLSGAKFVNSFLNEPNNELKEILREISNEDFSL
jgi:DNA polymerase elongation subunit (family B)